MNWTWRRSRVARRCYRSCPRGRMALRVRGPDDAAGPGYAVCVPVVSDRACPIRLARSGGVRSGVHGHSGARTRLERAAPSVEVVPGLDDRTVDHAEDVGEAVRLPVLGGRVAAVHRALE